MPSRTCGLSLAALLALLFLSGCNNALNPFCGSARPAPLIGSLSPSTMSFAQVQQGSVLIVNGSQFVSSSEVVINATALSTTVASGQQLKVTLTTGVISGLGPVNVTVHTPSGNSGDLGCTSGGNSSVLVLTVNYATTAFENKRNGGASAPLALNRASLVSGMSRFRLRKMSTAEGSSHPGIAKQKGGNTEQTNRMDRCVCSANANIGHC